MDGEQEPTVKWEQSWERKWEVEKGEDGRREEDGSKQNDWMKHPKQRQNRRLKFFIVIFYS